MIDFTTETERKRCKQIDKCQDLLSDVTDALGFVRVPHKSDLM